MNNFNHDVWTTITIIIPRLFSYEIFKTISLSDNSNSNETVSETIRYAVLY